eukprot:tig00000498_g1601.t1
MGFSIHKLAVALSILLVIRATHSAIRYRDLVSSTEAGLVIPLDIQVQCAVALVLCVWGCTKVMGTLTPLKQPPASVAKGFESYSFRPDFAHFNHRGKFLPKIKA